MARLFEYIKQLFAQVREIFRLMPSEFVTRCDNFVLGVHSPISIEGRAYCSAWPHHREPVLWPCEEAHRILVRRVKSRHN